MRSNGVRKAAALPPSMGTSQIPGVTGTRPAPAEVLAAAAPADAGTAQDAAVTLPAHPLALEPVHFPFRSLAAFAGRAALGGSREAGIGCFIAARLARELLGPRPLPQPVRAARATAARAALASLAIPAALRVPLARLVDASGAAAATGAGAGGGGAGASVDEMARSRTAGAAATLAAASKGLLDAPSRGELEQLARALARIPAPAR